MEALHDRVEMIVSILGHQPEQQVTFRGTEEDFCCSPSMAGKFHAKVPGMMQSSSKVISKELLQCCIAGQTTPHFPCLPKEFGKDWWRWSCCPFTHGMTPQNRDLQCLTTLALATLWPGIDQCYIPQHGPMAQSHLCSSWAWGGQ